MRTYTYLLSLFACLMLLASKSMAQPYTLRHLGIEDGLSNNYVTDIVQDSQGCIWIATEAGLNRFNGKDFTVYNTHNSDIAGDALTRLLYDPKENKLWIGTRTGISLLDCRTQEFEQSTPFDSIDMNNNIVSISPAADGGIWVANHYGKIVHYNKTSGKVTTLSRENIQGLPHSHWSVFDNGKGQLYVGHSGEGMSIIDLKSGTIKRYQNDPHNPKSLPGSSVYSIYIDHLENIWMGTNQGLALYNPVTEDFQIFSPMRGESPLGNLFHPLRTNLHLDPHAVRPHHRGVQGLVTVRFRNVHPVADPIRFRLVNIGYQRVDVPALRLFGNQRRRPEHDANREEIIDLFESDMLALHFGPDRIDRLDAPRYFEVDIVALDPCP